MDEDQINIQIDWEIIDWWFYVMESERTILKIYIKFYWI